MTPLEFITLADLVPIIPEIIVLVTACTVEKTILGSDLGQNKNPHPVDGFRSVVEMCLDIGYSDAEIRRMIGGNA